MVAYAVLAWWLRYVFLYLTPLIALLVTLHSPSVFDKWMRVFCTFAPSLTQFCMARTYSDWNGGEKTEDAFRRYWPYLWERVLSEDMA